MKKHIICFGDSNTHGYCADPADCADGGIRFNEAERWPCLLQKALGEDYLICEEGLNGRTTVFVDPINEGMDGLSYLPACLNTHEPVSLLILMLGTNDTKARFSASAGCIAAGMERLIAKAKTVNCWAGGTPNILLIAPPPIEPGMESTPTVETHGYGAAEKAGQLAHYYAAVAQRQQVHFADAAGCPMNTADYMHLTREGHAMLARRLSRLVPDLV